MTEDEINQLILAIQEIIENDFRAGSWEIFVAIKPLIEQYADRRLREAHADADFLGLRRDIGD